LCAGIGYDVRRGGGETDARLVAAMLAPHFSGLLARQLDFGHPARCCLGDVLSWRHDRFGLSPKIWLVARIA
jgi:hypothetical protein